MSKKFKSGIIIFIIVLALALLITGASIFSNKKSSSQNSTNGNPNGTSLHQNKSAMDSLAKENKKSYIAALYIEGTIEEANTTYNQKWLMSKIDELKYDSNNVGIALYINSPGGGVYQADEVYLSLLDYKKYGKKIYAYMGPLAASGGYYIACAADKIYANRNTLTGSIGVISGQVFDITELLYNLGIESTTIYAGDNKNMGNFNEPFTEEQQEIMQAICDEYYEQFLGIVVEQRNLTYEKGRELADGRVYTASQALKNGLIDKISDWDSMIENLSLETIQNSFCKVRTFKYEKKLTFMEELLTGLSNVQQSKAKSNPALPQYMYQR